MREPKIKKSTLEYIIGTAEDMLHDYEEDQFDRVHMERALSLLKGEIKSIKAHRANKAV